MSQLNRKGVPSRLDSLSSPGGRILTLLLLVLVGIAGTALNIPWSDKIALGALGVLLILLGGKAINL